jgi:hypothetical protein
MEPRGRNRWQSADGKEGVDGSSPSEGFRLSPAYEAVAFSRRATIGDRDVHAASTAWTLSALPQHHDHSFRRGVGSDRHSDRHTRQIRHAEGQGHSQVSYLRPSPISDIRARVKREYIDTRHGYIDRLQLKLCACVALGRARLHIGRARLHIAARRTTVFRRLSVHGPCAARSGSQ